MNNVINKEMLKLKVHTLLEKERERGREEERDKCAEKRTISSGKKRRESGGGRESKSE